ncbi:MAG: DUF4281 domain-containing protein [Planctomycetaceae bacterium]|nr:DUF4281 domain-containing protein [Planctomycetaceae bacterium]
MDPEQLFTVASNLALPGWILLAVAPRWRWSARFVAPVVIPGVLAALYAFLIFQGMAASGADFSAFNSLAGVRGLFSQDQVLLAGWVHYLVFDLFVGSWEVRDAQKLGIPHLAVLPCLFFTLMLGPVGWLAYVVLRGAWKRQWLIES